MDYFSETTLSDATKALYNSRLRTIAREFGDNFVLFYSTPEDSLLALRNYLRTIQSDTPSSLNSFVKSLISYKKYHYDDFPVDERVAHIWWAVMKQSHNVQMEYRMENKPSSTQADKAGVDLTYEDVCRMRDELQDDDIRKLLIAFYTMIPPVRADYYATRIIPYGVVCAEPNFLYYSPKLSCIKIGEHKMSTKHGSIETVLTAELNKLLTESLRSHPRAFLFVNKNNEPFTRASFVPWAREQLMSVFGKEFTLTMFRHLYISWAMKQGKTERELDHIAECMGHTRMTQSAYRWME